MKSDEVDPPPVDIIEPLSPRVISENTESLREELKQLL
jgi:hypothetical protein